MKKLEEIIKQHPIYLNDWEHDKNTGIIRDFELIKDMTYEEIGKLKFLFASYSYENYSGDAFVLLEKDNELYEVNGGHCSCFGLEGQFKLESTSLEALEHRLIKGTMGEEDYCGNVYSKELKEFLGIIAPSIETNSKK